MGPIRRQRFTTREEFLAWETGQEERWEYLAGVVKAMTGGRVAHNLIAGNIFVRLRDAARARGCHTFQHGQKLAPAHEIDVVYPDVFVTCERLADDALFATQAAVIVEVLSKSTREDDLSWKWELHKGIPDLRHYLAVETRKMAVFHYHRASPDEEWRFQIIGQGGGGDAAVTLDWLAIAMPLTDIHAGTDLLT